MVVEAPFSESEKFADQVAGHGRIFELPDKSLLKMSFEEELFFYKVMLQNNSPLLKYMPKCYNFNKETFELIKEKYQLKGHYLHMENLLIPFNNPNVMDLKLGTRLYSEKADAAKRERMLRNASTTTSLETGLKICGLIVYDKNTKKKVKVGKKYGRSLVKENLQYGILRFLLNFGEPCYIQANEDNREEGMDYQIFEHAPSAYTLGFIQAVLNEVITFKSIMEKLPVRIYGGSFCLIYESVNITKEEQKMKECKAEGKTYNYPFTLHYIDFAHSSFVDSELGVDTSLMTGLNNLICMLSNYIQENLQVIQN